MKGDTCVLLGIKGLRFLPRCASASVCTGGLPWLLPQRLPLFQHAPPVARPWHSYRNSMVSLSLYAVEECVPRCFVVTQLASNLYGNSSRTPKQSEATPKISFRCNYLEVISYVRLKYQNHEYQFNDSNGRKFFQNILVYCRLQTTHLVEFLKKKCRSWFSSSTNGAYWKVNLFF